MEPYSSDDIKRKKRRNNPLFDKLLRAIPEIKAAAIVSAEGLPIAAALPSNTDETRIAAMTAALLSLSERVIIEMRKGDFDQLYIKGSEGYLLVMQAGFDAVLVVSTTKDVRLGLLLLDCRRACEKIANILYNGYNFDDDDDNGDGYPYPYVLKPPEPPDDLEPAFQTQIHVPLKEKSHGKDIYCQYCGKLLTQEEAFSHNCRKRPRPK